MAKVKTVSFISMTEASKILGKALQVSPVEIREMVCDYGRWTYGDATHTLVPVKEFARAVAEWVDGWGYGERVMTRADSLRAAAMALNADILGATFVDLET